MNDFQKQLVAQLESANIIRGEGKTVLLTNKQFQNLSGSLIVYMDTEAQELAYSHKYLYLPAFSGGDRLLFADIMYTVHEYTNGIDVYGYEKTNEGSTREVTLATIKGRKFGGDKGDTLSLFTDLRNDIAFLFPSVDFNMPRKNLDRLAQIEIGKKDKFYSAGIVVVDDLNETTVEKSKEKALNYAKIDIYSFGVITDGYIFLVLVEDPLTGFWKTVTMDYPHFVGKLIRNLRKVF